MSQKSTPFRVAGGDPKVFGRENLYPLPGFDDPVSSMSHLIGGLVFIYLGYRLLRRNWGHPERNFYLAVYASSVVFLMAMSSVYHMMVFGGTARAVMARLDSDAIYTLIAGTFTPLLGILFRGWAKWVTLIFIWTVTIASITLKTIFFTSVPEWLGLTMYQSLGWLGAIFIFLIWNRYGTRFVLPLLVGGLCYSVGGITEYFGWPVIIPHVVEAHEVFHLWVLAGAAFHYKFVCQFADGNVNGQPIHPTSVDEAVESAVGLSHHADCATRG